MTSLQLTQRSEGANADENVSYFRKRVGDGHDHPPHGGAAEQ